MQLTCICARFLCHPAPLPERPPMLHLASLTYAYGPARPVLDIAAFDVPAGRHVLLPGAIRLRQIHPAALAGGHPGAARRPPRSGRHVPARPDAAPARQLARPRRGLAAPAIGPRGQPERAHRRLARPAPRAAGVAPEPAARRRRHRHEDRHPGVSRQLEERAGRDARGIDLVAGARGSPLQLIGIAIAAAACRRARIHAPCTAVIAASYGGVTVASFESFRGR